MSLTNRANRPESLGRHRDARIAAEECVSLGHSLAQDDLAYPLTYRRELVAIAAVIAAATASAPRLPAETVARNPCAITLGDYNALGR